MDVIAAALYFRLMQLQRYIVGYSGFPGQTGHRQAVGTVGGDLKLHRYIVQTDALADVGAQRSSSFLALQDKDAVFICVGEVMGCQAQFTQGAEHTVALLTAQLTLVDGYAAGQGGAVLGNGHNITGLDILGAGADRTGAPSPTSTLHTTRWSALGWGFYREQLAHYYILDFSSFIGIAFHLGIHSWSCRQRTAWELHQCPHNRTAISLKGSFFTHS